MTRHGHRIKLAVGVMVLAPLAGCGKTAEHAPPTATTPAADPAAAARQEAVTAYEGMWNDLANAAQTANWRDPGLTVHATDSALSMMVNLLKEDDKDGAILKGKPVMNPKVTSAEPTSSPTVVRLSDCLNSQNWLLYRKSTGALWDDKPGGKRAVNAEVVQSRGAWKVVTFDAAALGTC